MNQEIQQNTITNEKPRIYVSWRTILLDGFIFIATLLVAYFLYKSMGVNRDLMEAHMALVGISGLCFAIGVSLLLVIAIFKKPFGYVQTKFIYIIFASIAVLVIFFVSYLMIMGAGLGGMVIPLSFVFEISPPSIIALGFVFFINRKFQKSEAELEITTHS